ncbi:hypothetical protein B0T22DRAFT_440240 [Podospora appendiculata]|uniref:Nucleotidyl transferase AbiEii toxin, Type IV TA system n=1 Tax=Podospora appendiculata TaxID=314037 RepID=A0AAE1CCN3_9PEZI|nr:hypothetical protein B0T22DRAFT_440240 [Podospora appendiculata]
MSNTLQAHRQSLFEALEWVTAELEKREIPHAVAGGMAMLFLGSQERVVSDIDLSVDADIAEVIIREFEGSANIANHDSLEAVDDIINMQVFTADQNHEEGVTERVVQVDLIFSGHFGIPEELRPCTTRDFNMPAHTVIMRTTCYILNLEVMFRTKLRAFYDPSRTGGNDFDDLMWMLEHHTEAVRGFAHRLERGDSDDMRVALSEENQRAYFDQPDKWSELYDKVLGLLD